MLRVGGNGVTHGTDDQVCPVSKGPEGRQRQHLGAPMAGLIISTSTPGNRTGGQ